MGETGDPFRVTENILRAGDDAHAHLAFCHQTHQGAGCLAGTIKITAYIGDPAGIFDIGI